jgi:hypothetical protein
MSVYRYVDTQILEVRNPLFTVNSNITTSSPVDAVDIGFFGQYYNGTSVLSAGLFRDHTDGIFKLFSGVSDVIDPATIVGTGATGFTYGSLTINDLVAQGNATINGNLTVLGSQVILGTQTVTTTDNLIAVNTSPSAIMTDGGLISKRYPTAVTTNDTAKQSGTVPQVQLQLLPCKLQMDMVQPLITIRVGLLSSEEVLPELLLLRVVLHLIHLCLHLALLHLDQQLPPLLINCIIKHLLDQFGKRLHKEWDSLVFHMSLLLV